MIEMSPTEQVEDPSDTCTAPASRPSSSPPQVVRTFAPINTPKAAPGFDNTQWQKPRYSSHLRELRPAPARPTESTTTATDVPKQTTFYDLPAELRIEIYKLVLEGVTIHIIPSHAAEQRCPHALVRTSRQVRNEVLPLIHRACIIRANVTDFNFDGLLAWLGRIPPDQHANLTRNKDLRIRLCTTLKPTNHSDSLRKWLHTRADIYRPQPAWKYSGPAPKATVANDLRRRAKRMTEPRKQAELLAMLEALGVPTP